MSDRLTKRAWLLDNMDVLIRESEYHRLHQVNESLPGVGLWKLDSPLGNTRVVVT